MIYRLFKRHEKLLLLLLSALMMTSCSVRALQIKRAEEHYKKGQYLASRGQTDTAVLNFEKSIKIAEAAGFKEGVAHNLNELAIIYTSRGEYGKAREFITEALKIYRERQMAPETSKSLNNMAITYVRERRFQEAIKWFIELVEWDTKTDNRLGAGITLYNMALIYHKHLQMREEAMACFMNALKIFKETGNEEYIRMIQENINKE